MKQGHWSSINGRQELDWGESDLHSSRRVGEVTCQACGWLIQSQKLETVMLKWVVTKGKISEYQRSQISILYCKVHPKLLIPLKLLHHEICWWNPKPKQSGGFGVKSAQYRIRRVVCFNAEACIQSEAFIIDRKLSFLLCSFWLEIISDGSVLW